MAGLEITSEIFKIDSDISSVYSFLTDFNKIGSMMNMAKQMGGASQLGEHADKIEDVKFTSDTCVITVKNMGDVSIAITEKEEPKMIKLESGGGLPLNMTVWIQLLEHGPYDTRMRITLHSEMNMMLKMMLKGKLEKVINQVGEGLSKIPYMMLNSQS
ncbi:hypothetical protein LJB85_02625 [Porphyromonadaceae bacterium OttesenSCG-928-L07]|nr:hypothetical protein [Porphyromonadaceae bacterium OttesenSCG-928-L07]MDL2251793.1 hypothetical protein [Odoribacter sp. OttesenSCG-928-J03]MDL2330862.1 hypothetical protein [Odoribacter sp. OttesenSCG-928-A06]